MENKTPDFAIFQNSRTRQSALWVRGVGEWKRCDEMDYDPISVMALMLRASPQPVETLRHIAKAIDEVAGRGE
jgi:hypothetical protein